MPPDLGPREFMTSMENQAQNHRSLWSSEDLILQTNNRVQTRSQNGARSRQMMPDPGPQESMKSTQIHRKSSKIYEIYRKPVLANEREARFYFFGKYKEEQRGTNRSQGGAIGASRRQQEQEEPLGGNRRQLERMGTNRSQ